MTEKTRAIRYIGDQARKQGERVIQGSQTVWNGPRDVQWVLEKDALIYLKFPTIWELASDVEEQMEAEPDPLKRAVLQGGVRRAPSDPKANPELQSAMHLGTPGIPSDSKASEANKDPGGIGGLKENLNDVTTVAQAQDRLMETVQAISKLKKKQFNSDGKPSAPALAEILKRTVTGAERDAAWALVLEEMALRNPAAATGGAAATSSEGDPPTEDVDPLATGTLGGEDPAGTDAQEAAEQKPPSLE